MEPNALERFRQLVWQDPELTAALWSVSDAPGFIARVVELGHTHGFEFQPQEIEAAITQGRRAWFERNLYR